MYTEWIHILGIITPLIAFMGWIYARIDKRFDKVDQRFDKIEIEIKELSNKVRHLDTRVDHVEKVLSFR